MSSLLQNVLASRLAQATLGGEGSDQTSDKGKRSMGPPSAPASAGNQGLEEWESVDEAGMASDEELVGEYSEAAPSAKSTDFRVRSSQVSLRSLALYPAHRISVDPRLLDSEVAAAAAR